MAGLVGSGLMFQANDHPRTADSLVLSHDRGSADASRP